MWSLVQHLIENKQVKNINYSYDIIKKGTKK